MTGPRGESPQPNPYILRAEELTCPTDHRVKGKWFAGLVARQLEGIEHGVRPQFLEANASRQMIKQWRKEVWDPWRKRMGIYEQRPNEDQNREGRQRGRGSKVRQWG